MARYRYESHHDWLAQRLQGLASDGNAAELLNFANCMAGKLDGDTIQELFERDMDADGFFDDLDAEQDGEPPYLNTVDALLPLPPGRV
jgi:hypothetical protein